MRSLVIMTALMVAADASAALAQRGDLAVEQLPAPVGGRAVPQLGASGPTDSPAPTIQGQISSTRSGREPAVRQVAPRAAGATPTSQLADRNVNQRINALPPGLVDACARAAEGRGTPPTGVDCATLVEAAPPPPPISAEEALLTTDDERAAQRMASERQSRGQTPDAAEVARRLSAGDISNSPVAQAVAAQAASDAIANSQQAPGNTPVIVPGGGTVVVPRGN